MTRLTLFLLAGVGLFGQAISTITGTITDQTGSVIPNVKITATNIDTKVVFSGGASQTGNFALPVPPGKYDVSVEKPGLKKVTRRNVEVESNTSIRVDLKVPYDDRPQFIPPLFKSTPLIKTEPLPEK